MSPRATPLRLDTAACDGCGRCVPRCKPRALKVGTGYILVDWAACDGCGRCAEACDRGAIVLRSVAARPPVASPATAKPVVKQPKGTAPPAAAKAAGASANAPAPASGQPTVPGPEWSLPEAFLALLYAFALYVAAQAVPGAVSHAPGWSGATLVLYNVAIAGLLYFLARRRGVSALSAFRLDVAPEWSSMGLAAVLAIGCWLVSVGYRAVAPLAGLLPPTAEGADLTTLFGAGAFGAAATILVVAVLAPVLEEALVRGTVLGSLRPRIGAWPAIALAAVAFSLLHASVWSFVPLTVLGIALGWLATRSRSLWPAVTAHVLYNAVLVGAALYKALGV